MSPLCLSSFQIGSHYLCLYLLAFECTCLHLLFAISSVCLRSLTFANDWLHLHYWSVSIAFACICLNLLVLACICAYLLVFSSSLRPSPFWKMPFPNHSHSHSHLDRGQTQRLFRQTDTSCGRGSKPTAASLGRPTLFFNKAIR